MLAACTRGSCGCSAFNWRPTSSVRSCRAHWAWMPIRIAALCRAGLPPADVIASTLVDRMTIVVATLVFGAAMVIGLAGTRIPADLSGCPAVDGDDACGGVAIAPARRAPMGQGACCSRASRSEVRDKASDIARATLAYRHNGRVLVWVTVATLIHVWLPAYSSRRHWCLLSASTSDLQICCW